MPITVSQYLKLLTSEHNLRPNFLAFVSAVVQGSIDQQNQLANFPSLFDVDMAVGDQQDKIGFWVGVSRKIKQAIDVPTASDNFQRADGPLGANWANSQGTFGTVGHTARQTDAGFTALTYWVGSVIPSDQFSKVTIINGGVFGAAVRVTAGFNGYVIYAAGSILTLVRYVAGAPSTLAIVSYTPVAGDVLTLEAQGPNLTGKVNGVSRLQVSDAVLTLGSPGMAAENSVIIPGGASFWSGGPLPAVSVLSDADYRILLKLFIAMNTWDGTIPGIYTIWNEIFGTSNPIAVQDNQDMTMTVLFLNPPTDIVTLALLTQGYFLLRPAGVLITGFFEPSIFGDPVFGFDVENATISGFDVGAWMIPINV